VERLPEFHAQARGDNEAAFALYQAAVASSLGDIEKEVSLGGTC
jgi:hypothetical protein